MNHKPLVSVIVPSYNHSVYIVECVKSILHQSYDNFELIVIDDGSSDDSLSILKELKINYDFKLISKKNEGLSKTLNLALKKHVSGKYFSICSSDDYWHKNKLEEQVIFLQKNLEYPYVFSKAYAVDENSKILKKKTNEINSGLIGGNIFKSIILQKFHPPVNYMFRTRIFETIGDYDECIWAEDFDMNLRISEKYKVGFINKFLSYYRVEISKPDKNLSFKTIYSHKKSLAKFKHSVYYKTALKNWHYKCFRWYSPYVSGKKIAFIGMMNNIDKIFTREFLIFLFVLIRKWK